jgi:hypothetical protein
VLVAVVLARRPSEHQEGTPMSIARGRFLEGIPRTLGAITILTLVPLLAWDASPESFPERAHDPLAALPLAMIALACMVHHAVRRSSLPEFAKGLMLAAAFLFWAANQLWPQHPLATLFNDVAIALFVVDVFLVIRGRPSAARS